MYRRYGRRRALWVVRHRKGWVVKKEGRRTPLSDVKTQREAIAMARALAKGGRRELVVQNRRARIRIKNSYGPDRFPPRG